MSPPLRTPNEDPPTSYTSLKGSDQGCPLLRATFSPARTMARRDVPLARASTFI
jgi:hypothetical protein